MTDSGTNYSAFATKPLSVDTHPTDRAQCDAELVRIDKDFLLAEHAHAWQQHRHLENLRARYLAFIFSTLFAGIALIGSVIEEISQSNIGAIIFGIIVTTCSLLVVHFLVNMVNKLAPIFDHYEDVASKIRLIFSNSYTESDLNIRKSLPKLAEQPRGESRKGSFKRMLNFIGISALALIYIGLLMQLAWLVHSACPNFFPTLISSLSTNTLPTTSNVRP